MASFGAPFDRRESREGAKYKREDLAVLEPSLAAESEHADKCQDGIADRKAGDVERYGRAWIDELDPGERQQQRDRRPDAQPSGVGQGGRQPGAAREPAKKSPR